MESLTSAARRLLRGSPDEYRVIRSGPNDEREVIESDLKEPPDPDLYVIEHDLEPGTYRCQAIRDNKFGKMAWVREVGDPRAARETAQLRNEIEQIRSAIEDSASRAEPVGSFEDRLKRATFESVLDGDLDVGDARQIAALSAAFEGGGDGSLADSVEDPKDVGEIAGRGVLQVLDDPSRVERLGEAGGRLVDGFANAVEEGEQRVEHDDGAEDGAQSRLSHLDGGANTLDELGTDLGESIAEVEEQTDEPEDADAPITPEAGPDQEAVADGGEPGDDDGEPSEEEVADAI